MAHRRNGKLRGDVRNLVRFLVGGTIYAFDVQNVEEVVQPAKTTRLPRMSEAVHGVFDHRGRVTPILDLRVLFHAESDRSLGKWVLVRVPSGLVGFVVDSVLDVMGTSDELRPAPSVGPMSDVAPVRGVVHLNGELVFVLDEARLASRLAELELPVSLP